MPSIELPLAELLAYAGTNSRPVDFDAYWTAALEEMRSIDPQVDFRGASEFQIRHGLASELWFTGTGGARIFARYLQPTHVAPPFPLVICFHGYAGYPGDWSEKLGLVGQGFAVAALDCRGQWGRSEDVGGVRGTTYQGHLIRGLEDAPEKLLFRQIFLDATQLAGILVDLPEIDGNRVATIGSSQGGGLALATAALEPRINRCCASYPFLSDYRRVYELGLAREAYAELVDFIRYRDPAHRQIEAIFDALGYIDVQHLASRIRGEVLMGISLRDTCCPPSTQFAIYNKISAPKNSVIFEDFGHEGLPGFTDQMFQFLLEM